MIDPPSPFEMGVGATPELNLRVSAAVLVRVLIRQPETRQLMLALERTATSDRNAQKVTVIAKPFGGSVRILNEQVLLHQLGDFQYDSLKSLEEADFRIHISPAFKEQAIQFSLRNFINGDETVLETGPMRELLEEFADILGRPVSPGQFMVARLGSWVEAIPAATGNRRAPGHPTIRIYNLFQAVITDPALAAELLINSQHTSDAELRNAARLDAKQGGRGKANAVLVLPLDFVEKAYLPGPGPFPNRPLLLNGRYLAGNVRVILPLAEREYLR